MRAVISVLLLAACGSGPERVDESKLPEDFTFRWRVPTRVAITETTHSPTGPIVLAYSAALVREGDHLRFKHLDGEVRRLGDVVVDFEDRQRDQIRTAYALADLTDMLIASDGRVLGCVGSPSLRERASSYFAALPKATRNAYEIQVRDAADEAIGKKTCVERWQSWVTAWIGFEAIPGLPDHWNADVDVPMGEEPKIKVFDEHIGWLKKGGVRVTRRQEIDGSQLGEELVPLRRRRSSPTVW
jgi:hypothetical protein